MAIFANSEGFFARADELLAEIAKIIKDMPNCYVHSRSEHNLQFMAKSTRERLRFTMRFLAMAMAMALRGRTLLKFKQRPKDGPQRDSAGDKTT